MTALRRCVAADVGSPRALGAAAVKYRPYALARFPRPSEVVPSRPASSCLVSLRSHSYAALHALCLAMDGHEAARVYHTGRRCSGNMAPFGARAAAAKNSTDRLSHELVWTDQFRRIVRVRPARDRLHRWPGHRD